MIRYTDEERKFLKEYIPGHHTWETAKAFSERFRPITRMQVKSFSHNNHVSSGFRGSEGMPAWNKGKHFKASGRAIETQFKPGRMPPNWRPVGSERVTKDGYIEIKVSEPKTWMLKQRLVWERANGTVGKNEIIVFLDGNRLNCDLENLRCVNRSIHGVINHLHLTYCDAQTFETACAIAKLSKVTRAAKKRRKRRNDRENADSDMVHTEGEDAGALGDSGGDDIGARPRRGV